MRKVTIELNVFQVALINQAMNLYKSRLKDIITAAEDAATVNNVEFLDRLNWLKTEAGCAHEIVCRDVSSELLPLTIYKQPKF